MPSPLLHIQGALRLRQGGRLPAVLDAIVGRETWAYMLGAMVPDLPLFDHFRLKVGLFLVKRPYPESRWGTVLHSRGAGSLVAALLERALGPGAEAVRAMAAGMLTHVALDRAMHEPIEAAVRAHIRPTETPAQLHEALENYQSLVWHRAHLGCDGVGTPWLREITLGPNGARRLPPWLVAVLRDALRSTYAAAPGTDQVDRWADGLHEYRTLLQTPVARIGVRSSELLARRRPWVAGVELQPAFERGLDLAATLLEAAGRTAAGEERALAEVVGDGPLV
jgi:hypothetical protein